MYNQIRRQELKEGLIRQVQEAATSGSQHGKEIAARIKLIQGDFQYIDAATIGDKSIDLIFTDPPYHKEWLPMYEPLGKLACRVLKEGGSLVMYAGHYALPQIFDYMKNSGLKYWWEMVVKHNGSSRLLQYQRVYVMWKPLLWFVKGNSLRVLDSIADVIESQPPSKELHGWEQSPTHHFKTDHPGRCRVRPTNGRRYNWDSGREVETTIYWNRKRATNFYTGKGKNRPRIILYRFKQILLDWNDKEVEGGTLIG